MNYVTITEDVRDYYEACLKELKAYRTGGLTEEILRRKDGTLKLGKGCVVISQKTYDELIAINDQLRNEIDQLEAKEGNHGTGSLSSLMKEELGRGPFSDSLF